MVKIQNKYHRIIKQKLVKIENKIETSDKIETTISIVKIFFIKYAYVHHFYKIMYIYIPL